MEPSFKRLRWIVLLISIVGLMAGGGIAVWIKVRDLSRYQTAIVEQVRQVTGRELAAATPLHIGLSWRPTAIAEGVTLSNAQWGSRKEMLRVRKITMQLDLVTLLLGGLKIGKVTIEGADLLVETNANGESNLEMAPPPLGSGPHASEHRSLRLRGGPTLPWIGLFEISDTAITIAGNENRAPLGVALDKAILAAASATVPMQGELSGRIDGGAPFALRGAFGTFDGWMKGLPGKLDARGVLGAGTLAIEGSVSQKGVALGLKADGPDFSALSGFARLALPAYGPFLVEAKLTNQRNGYKIELPTLKVGDGQFAGEISFRTDRFGRRIAAASFEAPHLDITSLQPAPQQAQAAPPPTLPPRSGAMAATPQEPTPQPRRGAPPAVDSRLLPTNPLPIELLKSWNATLSVKLGEIVGGPIKITSAALTAGLSGGRLTFRPTASFGAGSVNLDFSYDVSGKVPSANLFLSLNKVSVEEMLLLFGVRGIIKDAPGDLDLKLRSTGRSIRELVTNASQAGGNGLVLTLGPGRLLGEYTGFITGDWRKLAMAAGGSDIAWNCAAVQADVSQGTIYLRRFAFDLPRIVAVGGGYIHSRSETFELLVAPEPREAALIAASVPLRIKGGAGGLSSETDAASAKLVHAYWPPTTPAPSLVAQLAKTARAVPAGGNACATFVNQVAVIRPAMPNALPKPPTAATSDRGRKR